MKCFVGKKKNFESGAFDDRKPVKFVQDRCYVCSASDPFGDSSRNVLDSLQLICVAFR